MALTAALPLHSRHSFSLRKRPSAGRLAGEVALGAAGLAIGGLALYFLKERSQEEAQHHVIERDGAFSLRRYARIVTAEVTRSGSLTEAMDEGYRPLADYISAKDGARQPGGSQARIAMTVPVTVSPGKTAGSWLVRFVMPRKWSRASLPAPSNGVELGDRPARTLAAVRFAGRGTDHDLITRKRDELLAWVAQRGLETLSEPEFAAYNAPIVPGVLRRNEWWVEVSGLNGAE